MIGLSPKAQYNLRTFSHFPTIPFRRAFLLLPPFLLQRTSDAYIMDDYNWKKSGQIPAFGDWERANELPITQYFENARQAGLIRYSSSSGECDPRGRRGDLYPVAHRQPRDNKNPPRKARLRGNKHSAPHVKAQKSRQLGAVTDPARKHKQSQQQLHWDDNNHNNQYKVSSDNGKVTIPRPKLPVRPPKPVDEDLYKIPPELLIRSSKRKKMPGLFSCLVPACAS